MRTLVALHILGESEGYTHENREKKREEEKSHRQIKDK